SAPPPMAAHGDEQFAVLLRRVSRWSLAHIPLYPEIPPSDERAANNKKCEMRDISPGLRENSSESPNKHFYQGGLSWLRKSCRNQTRASRNSTPSLRPSWRKSKKT
ncbi:hypothetical protein, partial [Treponema endosymbiont of Eucomonympha sp.]|uniref:hypothetical protein n=1 Tax=Treponema endosymbiont of Eucomonympha sp. TaxID=1580831 RepID=UPI001EE6F0FE